MRGLPSRAVGDRVAQMVAKMYFEPFVEPHFHPDSYGYRTDLAALLGAYYACDGDLDYDPNADFDANGCVDLWDLLTLLDNHGAGR